MPGDKPYSLPGPFIGVILVLGTLLVLGSFQASQAADWPTYRANAARSGTTPENLLLPLAPSWTFQPKQPPRPAWLGPAKKDLYNKVYDLKNRQIYDHAFHTVISGTHVLFGSSADDKVYCLNLESGQETWVFFTEGPVRFAPSVHEGRVYVGSDDGNVYCIQLDSGKLIWKTRLGPRDYRVPGNGRMISAWPVRTSVVVQDGLAYAGAGLFPSEGVYLCALKATDGTVAWSQKQNDLPAQGYLLASRSRLYVPSGRNNPVVCDINNGSRLRVVQGAGGTYALLTGDMLIFGPGKTGQLGVVPNQERDQLASFAGNHMIVSPKFSYLHTDTSLSALDRPRYLELARQRKTLAGSQNKLKKQLADLKKRKPTPTQAIDSTQNAMIDISRQLEANAKDMKACFAWKTGCDHPFNIILAGQSLFTGGLNEVAAVSTDDGHRIWSAPVSGRAYGLAVAHQRLLVSTDQGRIHCFKPNPARKKTARAQLAPSP